MKTVKRRRQSILIHMGVDFGRANAGVAEEFLNHPQVGASGEEMGGEGVTKKMGVDAGIKSGGLGRLFDNAP